MNRTTNIILWVCRVAAAIILLQSLFFKFTAAPESVYIFTQVGMEPWGRIGSGVAELIAAILLLIPRTSWLGALLGLGVMAGAIFFHLTKLGIEVKGDGGLLFIYAIIVLICCLVVAIISRRKIPLINTIFMKNNNKTILATFLFFLICMGAMAQPRIVLIEQFSNASCSVCGQYSPQVYSYAEQNTDKTVVITYHTPFPYQHDSFHFENPQDASMRTSFYSITGTPNSVMDGNFYKAPTASFLGNMAAKTDERKAIAAKYNITISNLRIENGLVKARVIFNSADINTTLDLRAFVVLTEKVVPKTAYRASPGSNSETEYKNVMRRMFNAGGKALINKQNGGADSVEVTFATTNVKSVAQLRVVAFVQNMTDKEVFNATSKDLQAPTTGIKEAEETAQWLYNPAEKQYIINFPNAVQHGVITVTDITGREVLRQTAGGNSSTVSVNGLKQGIYLATFVESNTRYFSKIIVE